MVKPLNATDRAALFSSDDWGEAATYTEPEGQIVRTDVLFDEAHEVVDAESGAVIDVVSALTFNRDVVRNPLRDSEVEFTDDLGVARKFIVGDVLESDETEFTAQVKEVSLES